VNTEPFTIIGVAPPGFAGLGGVVPELWLPLRPSSIVKPWNSRSTNPNAYYTDRSWWWCMIGGRMRPGATLHEVRPETAYLFRQSVTAGVSDVPKRLPSLCASNASPVFERLRQGLSTPLAILLVAASLVLLMACANVAALLVARATARQREIGARLATGASRVRVIQQLLTESSLLSACGGILGLLFAYWGAPALLELIAGRRQLTPLDVSPNGVVLAFAAVVSLGTGILFGLAPAIGAARDGLASRLRDATRSATPRRGIGKALVGLQIALSVVLLSGAGLDSARQTPRGNFPMNERRSAQSSIARHSHSASSVRRYSYSLIWEYIDVAWRGSHSLGALSAGCLLRLALKVLPPLHSSGWLVTQHSHGAGSCA
jgi:hypothetical protein